MGRCRIRIKLGSKTFEYYFQIIENLKRDLILGLNFHRTFKISQDVTDDNELYLHIRCNVITFSIQTLQSNKKNYVKARECMKLEPRSWEQLTVDVPKHLDEGAVCN